MNKRKEYNAFILDWMKEHGLSLDDLIESLSEYSSECNSDLPVHYIKDVFNEWVLDSGFNSMIWPCYEEWLDNEGSDN